MIKYDIENVIPTGNAESLFVKISNKDTHQQQFMMGVIYRPPQSSIHDFCDNFSILMGQLSVLGLPIFVAGDFSIDLRDCQYC